MSAPGDAVFARFPRLDTPRLVLRETTPEDGAAILRIFGDDEVMRHYNVDTFTSLEQAHALVARWRKRFDERAGLRFAITHREGGSLLGTCGVNLWDRQRGAALIGYDLARHSWGQGYATEAVRALTRFCFDGIGANRVEAHVVPGNDASVAVLRKLGFTEEGLLREYAFFRGRYQDLLSFSLLRRDLAPRA